jgi:DNA-directed RNA polymerase I subunit RPA2
VIFSLLFFLQRPHVKPICLTTLLLYTRCVDLALDPTPRANHQSPRNMYQCQMGKQTMGTPLHAFPHRADNKLYRIQNPQLPLVYNETHPQYHVEEYPAGANAVVAVISYTGYDMEDACIVSKGSFERGFGHASVYSGAQR